MPQIGIPRALYSYYYFPLWQKFFEMLDCEIILSPPTTKKILSEGVKIAPEEICLPVKTFLGHCAYLKNQCDYLLVPRMVCMLNETQNLKYGCPKAIGLPDIVSACFSDSINVIELTIDERKINQRHAYYKIGQIFSKDNKKIENAYQSAITSELGLGFAIRKWALGVNFSIIRTSVSENHYIQPAIGLIGHPYLIYDAYISLSLIDLIEKFNIKVITPNDLNFQEINLDNNGQKKISSGQNRSKLNNTQIKNEATIASCCSMAQHRTQKHLILSRTSDYLKQLTKDVHWFYEQNIIKSAGYLLKNNLVSGLIFAFSFSCGTSAVVSEIIKKELLNYYQIPTLTLLFDEHTAAGGLITRIESFVDLIQRENYRYE